jgi:hypothetical protein
LDRGSALEGFSALYDGTGNADAIVEQGCTLRVNVPHEQVLEYQEAGGGVCKGIPLGRMYEPEFWRRHALKAELIEQATRFVENIKPQGYEPLTSIYAFEVWGPYTEKVGKPQDWVPEADNDFIPASEKKVATTAWLYRGDEFNHEMGDVYLIRGRFTRKATLGKVDEERGLIVV